MSFETEILLTKMNLYGVQGVALDWLYICSALIEPHFDYCNLVWGNCGKTLSDRLQKLQNRTACVLTSSSYDTDAKGLIRKLGWKDLYTQRQIQKALMVYKSLNGLVPEYLSSKFLKRSGMRYSLRIPKTNWLCLFHELII